jgi:hypothetical protein
LIAVKDLVNLQNGQERKHDAQNSSHYVDTDGLGCGRIIRAV